MRITFISSQFHTICGSRSGEMSVLLCNGYCIRFVNNGIDFCSLSLSYSLPLKSYPMLGGIFPQICTLTTISSDISRLHSGVQFSPVVWPGPDSGSAGHFAQPEIRVMFLWRARRKRHDVLYSLPGFVQCLKHSGLARFFCILQILCAAALGSGLAFDVFFCI